jgi:hypothetical protein
MVLVKILKRKDASSVLVAILIAMIVSQPLNLTTTHLASKISGLHNGQYFGYGGPGSGWKGEYLFPIVWAILQLLILEILGWIYVLGNRPLRRKKSSK